MWGRRVVCPACGRGAVRFGPGPGGTPGRRCTGCGSLERHRAFAVAVAERPALLAGARRILHVAPEPAVTAVLPLDAVVTRGDLDPGDGEVRVDVTDLGAFADGAFDAIICSHVLEHVPDDRRALSELRRVLAMTGWAWIHVPVVVAETVEDPGEDDPEERLRRFGQRDHVRAYGPDVYDRMRDAGFRVEVVAFTDEAQIARHGLRAPLGVETVTLAFPA